MTNRREFLQTSAAIAESLLLPESVFATPSSNFHFLHADSYTHWPVADPVLWSLKNAHEPILTRAAEGLSKLTTSDGDRIMRIVVRRCGLNLVEGQPHLNSLTMFVITQRLLQTPSLLNVLHRQTRDAQLYLTDSLFRQPCGDRQIQ